MSKDFTEIQSGKGAPESKLLKDQRTAEWISRNKGAVTTALAGAGLVLPALAAAQTPGGFVLVDSIQGVASSQMLANGSLQLTLANGSIVTVAAENVAVLASGQIAVTSAAAASVASAAAAVGALSTLPAIGGAVGGLAAVAGIAGGDEGGSAPALPQITLATQTGPEGLTSTLAGIDAPEGATSVGVQIGEVSGTGTIGEDGAWSFDIPDDAVLPQGTQDVVITFLDEAEAELAVETVAFDIDTIAPVIALDALPVGAALGSAEAETAMTVSGTTDAEDGQTVTVTINGKTYTATASGGTFSVSVPVADLQALPEGDLNVTATVADAAGNPSAPALTSVNVDFTAPTIVFDTIAGGELNKVETQSDLVITGRTDAEVGQTVTVTFNGTEFTGTVTVPDALPDAAPAELPNVFSVTIPQALLGALPEDTTGVSIDGSVADVAGNIGHSDLLSLPANLFGPSISITALTVGDVLNIAEAGADLTVSGTTSNVQDGQVVTLSLNGVDYTATVARDAWSLTIPAADLQALPDGALATMSAAASDADSIAATPATASLTPDFSAPTLLITSDNTENAVNIAEKAGGFTVSGSTDAEVGQTVTVFVNGSEVGTATVILGPVDELAPADPEAIAALPNAWEFAVPGSALAALTDGAITVTAIVSDVNGNPATEASYTVTGDFTAPTLTVDTIAGGELNKIETLSDLEVTGTTTAEDGQTVTLTFNGKDYTATVEGGRWTATIPTADLVALPEETTSVTYSATVSDAAGNPASVAATTLPANLIGPSISIDPISGDNFINGSESTTVAISGTTSNVEADQTVTVSVTGLAPLTATVLANGTWTTTTVTLPADGTFAVTADVADAGGLAAPQASASLVVDQTPPTIAITSLGAGLDDVLNAAEQAAGITVSGTTNAEDGQTVTISINGVSVEATASAGAWSANFTGANLAGIGSVEGSSVAVTADVSDAAGNAAVQASTNLDVDTVAPSVTHVLGDEAVINIAERAAGLTLAGTTGAPDGATVLIEFFDAGGATVGTASGTAAGGAYSIAVTAGTLAGLPDGATLTLRVSAADAAGNVGEDTETITTDFTAPTVGLNALPAFVNLADSASDQTITGTAEDGASVVVTVNGTALAPVTATGGVWSITIPAVNVQALPDNSTITVSAVATDAAGNPSAAAEGSFQTDFTPPTITLDAPEGTLTLGLADLEEDGNVDGTTDLPDGAIITAEILDAGGAVIGSKTGAVASGAFDVVFTSAELTELLADGETYTVRASGADAAGNPASSEFDFDTDFTPPAVAIDAILAADVIAALEGTADLTISGTSDEDGATVSVDFGGTTYTSGAVAGGVWSVVVPFADVQALATGVAYTATATTSDAAGNEGTDEAAVPGILMATSENDGALNLDDLDAGVQVDLQSFGIAAGTAVNVAVNGGAPTATAVVAGGWSVTLPGTLFSSIAAGGNAAITATATVNGAEVSSTETLTAYLPADYFLVQSAVVGSEVTVSIYLPGDFDATNGVAAQFEIAFDPAIATYKANSFAASAGLFGLPNEAGAAGGSVSLGIIAATDPGVEKPIGSFKMTVVDPTKPIEFTVTDEANLPASTTEVVIGTDAVDTITADSVVSYLVQGNGGDDVIDISGAATAVIVLDGDATSNGTDTITGFTTFALSDNSDTLVIGGVDLSALRGDGSVSESLASGGAIGANTGIFNFTTALTDLTAGSFEAGAESLTGLTAGDAFYMVATDGTDAALAFVSFDGTNATADVMAVLNGVNDVTNFVEDNILAIDATGTILA